MIKKGEILVRLKGGNNRNGKNSGTLFEAFKDDAVHAWISNTSFLKPGKFSFATYDERQAYARGTRTVTIAKRSFKDFTELNNQILAKKMATKKYKPRRAWSKEDILKLAGYVRGATNAHGRIAHGTFTKLDNMFIRETGSCAHKWKILKHAPPVRLKKIGITVQTFLNTPNLDISLRPLENTPLVTLKEGALEKREEVLENSKDIVHVPDESLVSARLKIEAERQEEDLPLVVRATLLLVNKFSDEDKLLLINNLF